MKVKLEGNKASKVNTRNCKEEKNDWINPYFKVVTPLSTSSHSLSFSLFCRISRRKKKTKSTKNLEKN